MSNANEPIRITPEELASTHVDDLLKRQMNMRGEPGVTRDRRRKWYYQNWLLFMVAGALGALTAWAILEPVYDDQLYVQGPVSAFNPSDILSERIVNNDQVLRLLDSVEGAITINGEKIHFLANVRELLPGGGTRRFDPFTLKAGETLGIYLEYYPGAHADLALSSYVVRNPPPVSAERSQMKLGQLAARSQAASLFLFPLVAGLIGLFIGATDGIVCRLPRRALLGGTVGFLVGAVGGFVGHVFANLAYAPLHDLAMVQYNKGGLLGAFGFAVQMVGRSLAWALAGLAMGLGQGVALRSPRLLLYGLIGGIVGALFGGMLFDPIDLLVLGADKPSAHWSRLIGFVVIGLSVGGFIGIVELLARDAWLRMTQGPLTGKEFLLFKDVMSIGSSPRSDIYLFNDPKVSKHHASIRAVGDECEIEAQDSASAVLLNNRAIQRARLRHGDNITIGRTSFVFQRRKG